MPSFIYRDVLTQVQHLVESRELSRGMGNLIKFMRFSVSKISPEISEAEAKHILLEKLQSFLEERIVFAAENIAKYVISTIRDGDVILTFGSSPLVRKVLLLAANAKSFRLVVVDSRPLNEGLATLTALSHKVHCVVSKGVFLSRVTNLFPYVCIFVSHQLTHNHPPIYVSLIALCLYTLCIPVLASVGGGGGDAVPACDKGAARSQQSAVQRSHARTRR